MQPFQSAWRRGFVGVLILLLVSGCSSPAYREFEAARLSPSPAVADAGAPPELGADGAEDLAAWLRPLVEREQVPGIAAVVLRGDQIIGRGVAGVRKRGSAERVTFEDHFHIASCAKAMSATLIARLVEQGMLEWDRPLTAYFPESWVHPAWQQVTLRHLLSHSAGVRDPLLSLLAGTYLAEGVLPEKRAALVAKVLRSAPAGPVGDRVRYSNMGYVLMAAAAERQAAASWEQLMEDQLFGALGLKTAGFGPPGAPGELSQPWGHGKFRALQVGLFGQTAFDPGSRGADYAALASPAGYIHLSLSDWARFVALHLRAHEANPQKSSASVLQAETFRVLHHTYPDCEYAGGWNLGTRPWAKGDRPRDTGRVLHHVGDNGRWTSIVWMAPEIDFAVLVACNRGDMASALDEVVAKLVARYSKAR